jgi:hypothetical protein
MREIILNSAALELECLDAMLATLRYFALGT